MSPILVTFTSHCDFDFERSNSSLRENTPNGVNLNSNGLHYCIRKNEGKILWFSADCIMNPDQSLGNKLNICCFNHVYDLIETRP